MTEHSTPKRSPRPLGDTPLGVFLLAMLYGELAEDDERGPWNSDEFIEGWMMRQECEPAHFVEAWTSIGQTFGALQSLELVDQGALAEVAASDIRWAGRDGALLTDEQFSELLSRTQSLHAELLALCTESDIASDAAREYASVEEQETEDLPVFPPPTKQDQFADFASAVSLYAAIGFSPSAPDCIFALCTDGVIRLYGRAAPFIDSPFCRAAAAPNCDLGLSPLQRMALSDLGAAQLRMPVDWIPTVSGLTSALGKQDDRAVGRWLYEIQTEYGDQVLWTAAVELRVLLKKVRGISDLTAALVANAADSVRQIDSSSRNDIESIFAYLRNNLFEEDDSAEESSLDDRESHERYNYHSDIMYASQDATEWCTAILPTLEAARMSACVQMALKLSADLHRNYQLAPTWPQFCGHYAELRRRQVRAVHDAEAICQVAWSEVAWHQNTQTKTPDVLSLTQVTAHFTPNMIEAHRVLLEHMVKQFEDKAHPVLIATQGVALVQAFVQMMAAPHLTECRSPATADILTALRSHLTSAKASKGGWTDDEEDLSYCVNVAWMTHHISNIARHRPDHPLTRPDASLMLNGLLVLLNRIDKQRD